MIQDPYVLILYYSQEGHVERLAQQIAMGVESGGMVARLRTVPAIPAVRSATKTEIPQHGDLFCENEDLTNCSALFLGSPTHFGNMAAPLKYFIDETSELWINGALIGKPAGVFTSTSSMHGGQESTLLSMMIPLLHHGMMLTGVPYSEPALTSSQKGGTPYGASHLESEVLSEDEIRICRTQGKRMAALVRKLL